MNTVQLAFYGTPYLRRENLFIGGDSCCWEGRHVCVCRSTEEQYNDLVCLVLLILLASQLPALSKKEGLTGSPTLTIEEVGKDVVADAFPSKIEEVLDEVPTAKTPHADGENERTSSLPTLDKR
ncbi:MAG: hypothetical protein A3D96_00105 [Chlamydiae bacterium RIFCSPHIGHO2_12_FULL_44_59]|nr:MAG: hypothetical protein A2796_04110 [Chlamydiae bacterium RIFCSPHIGHO2_01_FULL_44_39]OGN60924.1 MAG: hypothetical protein A3D96_00105 [Chlamydiae bacterium RIFCSPHIGHO2_12_FULL_44_59]OGN66524.1 MAG: hypothetical protein A2978_05580 [Chlamydiae bacterium RIFCSPLOWO2_01_FULL_44_52]OGN69567.1 MAG: hypothetical protein A3I67_01000 [Chlamydiae bacterium RIFCSPLOWO2_02_FULL_45_22]OGN70842.1 MAG: hypothetical protein A3F79_05905 [Chlamydiae bacterium RIFCSPLOWO2_12_FULL_45_20]